MVIPGSTATWAPSDAPVFTIVLSTCQSKSVFKSPWMVVALGILSFINTQCGPMNTWSWMMTPRYKELLFWILHCEPIFTSLSIYTFLPRIQLFPMIVFSRIWAWCQMLVFSPIFAVVDISAEGLIIAFIPLIFHILFLTFGYIPNF